MNAGTFGLIIGLILAVIVVLLILFGGKDKTEVGPESAAVRSTPPVPAVGKVDDLTLVEGIGPKIAGILNQHDIKTFAQLAATNVATLENILKENALQFTNPGSWPEQARLAAEGKMDELKALQEKLIGGR
jgi:predicted flap endonuclease-1-like 5' DNA nuclease